MIHINTLTPAPPSLISTVRHYAPMFFKKFRKHNSTVSITLCTNPQIRKLNKKYRKIDRPTDVLAFPIDHEILGDIFISLPYAHKNAQKYGNTFIAEILYLIIHGLCHLLGHDHVGKEDTVLMKKKENVLLKLIAKDGLTIAGRI